MKFHPTGWILTFTGERVWTCGPEAVLTHHLCLGVTMAGVEAVCAAGDRLTRPHRGEAEHLAWMVRPQRLAHAPATQNSLRGNRISCVLDLYLKL